MNHPDFIERLKKADEQSFIELMEAYQHRVYNTVLSLLQHKQDAEDITQEVFLQVFKSVHSFRGEAKLSTWIYRIALSKVTEFERRRKAKKRIQAIMQIWGGAEEQAAEIPDFDHPGILLQQKEQAQLLFKAIRQLPENQRQAFILIKAEGLTYLEAGEIMDKNVKSLEGLLHRAKEQLRIILKDHYQS